MEFPPAGKGTFSALEEWKGKFPEWDPPGGAGLAGLLSGQADFNPPSGAQGEERGWVREMGGGRSEAAEAAGH